MSDERQPPSGDEDNQQPASGAAAPVPRRPRRVRGGYAAGGTDISQFNAYLSPPTAPEAAETSSHPVAPEADAPEATAPEAAADGTA